MGFNSTLKELDSRIYALEVELSDLKRKRNSLLPISQLPPEILWGIFVLSSCLVEHAEWVDYDERMKPRGMAFSHVSHSWRAVCLECHELWGHLHVGPRTTAEMLSLAFDRAKHAPIYLDLSGNNRHGAPESLSAHTASGLAMIAPTRYRALDLYVDQQDILCVSGGSINGFTNLVSLRLELFGLPSEREVEDFLQSTFPQLRRLTITGEPTVPLDCGPFQSAHLTHIDVDSVKVVNNAPSDLLAIFKRSSGLRNFRIGEIVGSGSPLLPDEASAEGRKFVPVALPTLERLKLFLNHKFSPTIVAIMSSISIPDQASLVIAYSDSLVEMRDVMTALQQACGPLSPVELRLGTRCVEILDNRSYSSVQHQRSTSQRSIQLKTNWNEPFSLHLWEWGLSFAGLRNLTISELPRFHEGAAARFWALLAETPLETIDMKFYRQDPGIDFLSSFTEGTARLPWACLRNLTIGSPGHDYRRQRRDYTTPDLGPNIESALDIVDVLKARESAGSEPLSTLKFNTSFDACLVDEHISQVLGSGAVNVTWYVTKC